MYARPSGEDGFTVIETTSSKTDGLIRHTFILLGQFYYLLNFGRYASSIEYWHNMPILGTLISKCK
jgi:hypothetical protein